MNTRFLTQTALIACVYIALTLVNPIGWLHLQLRISEALCTLPFFYRKTIPGVVLGVVVANFFSPLGLIDVAAGFLCAAITYSISYFVKNPWINTLIYALVCGIIIGYEIHLVEHIPFLVAGGPIVLSQLVICGLSVLLWKRVSLKSFLNE